jgi:hypothetical protein
VPGVLLPFSTWIITQTLKYLVIGVGTAITKLDWILQIFRRSCHRTCPSQPVGVAISDDVDCHLGGAILGFARCEG